MLFEQIKVGKDNFAYLIADEVSREAAIVDPSYEPEKVLKRINELDLKLKFLFNTHGHHDHINGNDYILKNTKAKLVGALDAAEVKVGDEDTILLGNKVIKIIATPGHTADSVCILVGNKLITGDTLFIGDVGLTHTREEAWQEFNSLKKIIALGDDIEIYPGHDYGEIPFATIAHQKKNNICIKDVIVNDFESFLQDK